MNLTADSTISQKEGLVTNEIDGETVMMSIEQGSYYGMNVIGSRIWELVKEPKTAGNIVEQLMNEYNVSREQCEKDVFEYIKKLADENILEITNEGN